MIKVWPFPPGVSWWQVAKEERARRKQSATGHERDPRSHSFVIKLSLSSATATETPKDARAIKKIMDQLEALLVDPESELPAVGNVEGYDRNKPGRLRLILSCPDSNALAKKLQPFLAKLKWPYGFTTQKKRTDFRTWQDVFD